MTGLRAVGWMFAVAGMPVALGSPQARSDYQLYCQGCHGPEGQGSTAVPALRDNLSRLIATSSGREYVVRVPGVAYAPLDDARLSALLNWTVERFSQPGFASATRPFTVPEVAELRASPLVEVEAARAALAADDVKGALAR